MPDLRPLEQIDAGGVDSRSNPINMPRNRCLRCLNWVPKQAGYWELRYGYSSVSMSSITASTIHSIFPYRTWNGTKYVLFMQGTTLNVLNTGTGIVTTPTVNGTAVASSAKGAGFFANNRFHYGNGTDQKWFDATTWRDSGLPQLDQANIVGISTAAQSITVTEGVREFTPTQASTVTLTLAAGGSFPADTLTGHLIYVAIFDTSVFEIGPATISVGSGRAKFSLNNKLTVANMPDLSTVNTNWVKLIAGTVDGGSTAWFFTNTSTAITNLNKGGLTITATVTAHGLSNGDVIIVSGSGGANGVTFDGVYSISVTDANTIAWNYSGAVQQYSVGFIPDGNYAGGTVKRIVKAANATTTVDVLAPTQDTSYQVNQNLGLAASTIGGANPGYQFYVSLYMPTAGGHVGNRLAIGPRALQTAYRCNWRIGSLPTILSGGSGEWRILFGRTGDGALVPYVCTDNASNWTFTLANTQPIFFLTQANIDGNHELPTRNGIIPPQCNMFAVAGDYIYAADTGSPTLRRSGSLADDRAGIFVGRPEQSFAPNDIDTFPTAEAMTGIFEVDQEIFCGTLHDSAISTNLAGIQSWVGPWQVGIAGRRAGTKCGAHGFYWLSGDKQLCTLEQGVPIVVSDEYELAELSQIGDAHLSTVELTYYRSAAIAKDEIRIEGQKADGTPYTIIHDFKNRELFSAPGSYYGQGYSSQFAGPLAMAFTVAQIRDANGALQVYAGATNGQLYQFYSGADDAGTQYTADAILLLNGGPDRPSVPFVDFYGDQNVQITVGRNLQTSLALGSEFTFNPPNDGDSNMAESVPGAEQDFLYRVFLVPPEVQRLYLRFELTSHSADGNLTLNSPPHVPLESYGRIYEFIPAIGDERAR